MKTLVLILASLSVWAFSAFHQKAERGHLKTSSTLKEKLSAYNFFEGNIAEQKPASGVIPYSLNTPLFSDYAEKLRFVKVPENQVVNYNATEVLDFPVGTTLIKTFYFPNDFRDASKGRKIVETRLLINESDGWKALTYIWNDEQTDAFLEVAGDTKEVSYVYLDGKKKKHDFVIPNVNQCKGCHNRSEVFSPIGPSARQLNGAYNGQLSVDNNQEISDNQLLMWQRLGILKGLPDLKDVSKAAVWSKPETGTLDERARIWLDINCAHCHRPEGPASTSGLNLSIHNKDLTTYGILKTPVAAGRASSNLKFDIVPQKPEESILIYRLASTDPGIRMPEVGRNTVHKESLELLKSWIKNMK